MFSVEGGPRRIGVRFGDAVLDLSGLTSEGVLPPELGMEDLNAFMAAGRHRWAEVRDQIVTWLTDEADRPVVEPWLVSLDTVAMHLPFAVADYVDFYASEAHASNVGALFRPNAPALPEAWRHLPIGYHGRSGTVVVSGTPIRRPRGQRRGPDGPLHGPTERLDFELELGFVIGVGSTEPVDTSAAGDHVFGVVLLNDWSARDIQAWEYVPLGPFLGKSFATSISPWVVPMAALDAARVAGPPQDPEPPAYLRRAEDWALDLSLEAAIQVPSSSEPDTVARAGFRDMYWTVDQMIAHVTVNGASMRTGDLLGSGTVSGVEEGTWGSLLEASRNGSTPLTMADGSERGFLEDGDEVVLRGRAGDVDLGEVRGIVLPA